MGAASSAWLGIPETLANPSATSEVGMCRDKDGRRQGMSVSALCSPGTCEPLLTAGKGDMGPGLGPGGAEHPGVRQTGSNTLCPAGECLGSPGESLPLPVVGCSEAVCGAVLVRCTHSGF